MTPLRPPVDDAALATAAGGTREIEVAATHEQPGVAPEAEHVRVTGELALPAYLAGDTDKSSSTSFKDLGLSSQLAVIDGPWRYNHLLEAHITATPELFTAPLQHAQARFDVYLMRLAYTDGRYAAALGRQPAAPLGEFGVVDGARATVRRSAQASMSPGSPGCARRRTSGSSSSRTPAPTSAGRPRQSAGARARVDAGLAVDEYKGSLDRAAAAASASVSTKTLSCTATPWSISRAMRPGRAPASRAPPARARHARQAHAAALSAGYDRPFVDRVLRRRAAEHA